jgi:hypothetical protein
VQPSKGSAARPLAITAFALTVAGGVFYLLGILIRLSAPRVLRHGPYATLAGGEFGLLANIIWLAAFIVFIFFLRSTAVAIGEKRLARHVVNLLITGACYLAFVVVLVLIAVIVVWSAEGGKDAAAAGIVLLLLTALGGLAGLALYIWYLVLLHWVRGAVSQVARKW